MTEQLTDFERARALIIARNQARLAALGIHEATSAVNTAQPKSRDGHSSGKKRKSSSDAQAKEVRAPQRRSKRLRGQVESPEDTDDDKPSESQTQLAAFMINGVCPKCGRVVTRGHKTHLDTCQGAAQRPQKSLAELIKAEMEKIETDNAKLQELELGGLVEFDDDHAVFMVVGSTGRHYKVDFTPERRRCQCPDHRIRKRDCKHIRLLLKSLNIEDDPGRWKSATANLVTQRASEFEHEVSGDIANDEDKDKKAELKQQAVQFKNEVPDKDLKEEDTADNS